MIIPDLTLVITISNPYFCLVQNNDLSNIMFQLAVRFVKPNRQTFIHYRQGRDRETTFLKYIKENTFKRTAIVAPTGVAAINAGGVTIHSFFSCPSAPL